MSMSECDPLLGLTLAFNLVRASPGIFSLNCFANDNNLRIDRSFFADNTNRSNVYLSSPFKNSTCTTSPMKALHSFPPISSANCGGAPRLSSGIECATQDHDSCHSFHLNAPSTISVATEVRRIPLALLSSSQSPRTK